MEWSRLWDPVIYTAIGGVLVALLNMFTTRRKIQSEETDSVSTRQLAWIEKQEDIIESVYARIARLEDENKELRARLDSVEYDARVSREALTSLEQQHARLKQRTKDWNEGIKILIAQIEDHGSSPNWRPG